MSNPANSDQPKPSKVENIKRDSAYLRGKIPETLAGDATHFDEAEIQLLKFHGIYQQDDRDLRRDRRAEGLEKAFMFMVRLALPGGTLSAEQYRDLDDLADRYANGTLRVTTRQGIQFHGVLKRDLRATIADINQGLLTTLSACGDVERNVMACPAPLADEAHRTLRRLAREIAIELRPQSRAYHEIWIDDEKVVSAPDDEPFYGPQYLPRKFKTGVTLVGDNSIDVYSYDAGLVAILDDQQQILGYNVLVGGGMGMTHKKPDTYARLASEFGLIDPPHAVATIRTIAAIFRDHGNRSDRRHARLKYLLEEWGLDRFRDEFRARVDFPLHAWRAIPPFGYADYVGAHPQEPGKVFYGLSIANGRIADFDEVKLKSALRTIATDLPCAFTLTANQNVLVTGLPADQVDRLEQILLDHGVPLPHDLSAARRYAMACPALPTCGLAMAESERIMPDVVDRLETELTDLGLRDVPITIRMTGCPNGCARPYTADIAFVGKSPDFYNVYVGGGLGGDRLADLYAENVNIHDAAVTLRPLLSAWAARRKPDENLSDYYQRCAGPRQPRQLLTGRETPTIDLVKLEPPA